MGSLVHRDLGHGPVVVLLHGVGVGPESFDRLADRLHDHRVVVVERPVGPEGAALSVAEQADRLALELIGCGADGGLVVGVSGGATVGLALAIRHPEVVGALAVHEPLLGRQVQGLHEQFETAAALAATGDEGAMTVVRTVMGDATWEALGDHGRAAAQAQVRRWRGEIAEFAAFDPSTDELAGLGALPVLVTYGADSRPERQQVAIVLHDLAGARVAAVPGAANAAQLDAPDAYADLLTAWNPMVGYRS